MDVRLNCGPGPSGVSGSTVLALTTHLGQQKLVRGACGRTLSREGEAMQGDLV